MWIQKERLWILILTLYTVMAVELAAILILMQHNSPVNVEHSFEEYIKGHRIALQLEAIYRSWKNLTGFKRKVTSFMFERNPNIFDVDCDKIMEGNEEEIMYTKTKVSEGRKSRMVLSDEEIATWSRNCTALKLTRKYITTPLSLEEKEYAIAYIINLYTGLQSFEHLLRSIYHPQNVYCIHVDQKSDPKFQQRVAAFVRCFDNVFFASKMIEVYYGHWSIVQSNLNCMDDLVRVNVAWKYAINVCAFDFPIKTNLEIVRALKNLKGKNSVVSWNFSREPERMNRYNQRYEIPRVFKSNHEPLIQTGIRKDPPPHNIALFDGSFFAAFRREAVEYLLQNQDIQDLFKWAEDTLVPDEMAWATIQRMYPKFPGSVPPDMEYDNDLNSMIRYLEWNGPCDGMRIRDVCVFAAGDLHRILNDSHLFMNKIGFKVDPVAPECLAESIRRRAIDDVIS